MNIKNLDTKQKAVLTVAALAALYGLAYLVMWIVKEAAEARNRKAGGQSQSQTQSQSQSGTGSTGSSSSGAWPNTPLRWGSGTARNQNPAEVKAMVKQLQKLCNHWAKTALVVDGIWGDKTEAAVQRLKNTSLYNPDNPTRLLAPFDAMVAPVQSPAAAQSKVQVWAEPLNEAVRWHNANYKSYKTYSTNPLN